MIYVFNDSLKVQGYQKILKVSDSEIVLTIYNKTFYIIGNDLIISEFEEDEFYVKGIISSLVFR
ncbi:MAG: YabP/YqfC family sporulation protein [Erysipelotrichaceae bacterium]|nr:YabP/YqfC family sporulation protein [Erysipelotrichaceae bacterium]